MLNLTLWDLLIRLGAYLLVGAIAGILSQLVLRALGGKATSESGGPGFACFDVVGMVFALLFKQGWGRGPQPEPGGLRGGRIGLIAWVVLTLGLTLGALALLPYANRPIASFGNNIVTQAALSVLGAASDLGVWFVIVSLLPMLRSWAAIFSSPSSPACAQRLANSTGRERRSSHCWSASASFRPCLNLSGSCYVAGSLHSCRAVALG
ncbi:hypothetical protein [Paradevosia shaoguanensis]|uniref:hypothetical protein n=1 Tax=Paradevosia shaoguanensis TaxID=1335043 RepID=UPI003C715AFE